MTRHRRNASLKKLFRLWQKYGWIFIPGWWEKTEKISRKKMKRKDKKKLKMRYRDIPF